MNNDYFKKTLKYIFFGTFKSGVLKGLFIWICLIVVVDIYTKTEVGPRLLKYSFFLFLLGFLPAIFHLMLQLLCYFFKKEFFNLRLVGGFYLNSGSWDDIRNKYAVVKENCQKPKIKDTVFSIFFNVFYVYTFFFCLYFSIK